MKFDCVIFDIDGTLADTLDLCVLAFQETFKKELGNQYSHEEIFCHFGLAEGGIISKFVGQDQYPQVMETYYQELEKLHLQKDVVMPGIRPLLEDLKGRKLPMAVVTGKGKHSADLTMRVMELMSYFEMMESGSDVTSDKTLSLGRVVEKMGLDPQKTLYVGDLESDIQAAHKVGMWAAGAAWATTATLHKNGWGNQGGNIQDCARFSPLASGTHLIFHCCDSRHKYA